MKYGHWKREIMAWGRRRCPRRETETDRQKKMYINKGVCKTQDLHKQGCMQDTRFTQTRVNVTFLFSFSCSG